MTLSQTKYVAVGLFTALLLAGSAHAQGHVFTNDDIPSAPAPAAQPATSANAAESSAETPAAGQPAPPADNSEAQPAGPQDEVKRLTAMVNGIGQASDFLFDKIQEGTADEATIARWSAMRDSLTDAYTEFRQFLSEAQAEADRAAAAPPENAPAPQ